MYLDLVTLYDNYVVFLWSNTTHKKANWWLKATVQNILVPKTFSCPFALLQSFAINGKCFVINMNY